jgi:hypothetical protein
LHYLCCVIPFVEEESGCRKASLSDAKRKVEESAEEAESAKVAHCSCPQGGPCGSGREGGGVGKLGAALERRSRVGDTTTGGGGGLDSTPTFNLAPRILPLACLTGTQPHEGKSHRQAVLVKKEALLAAAQLAVDAMIVSV